MAVIKRVSLVDQVYEKLRERIVQLKIPFGSKLNVSKLQEEYGVSSTPVREALNRLLNEGLIEFENNVGARVIDITEEDVREIQEIAFAYQMVAARNALRNGDAVKSNSSGRHRGIPFIRKGIHAKSLRLCLNLQPTFLFQYPAADIRHLPCLFIFLTPTYQFPEYHNDILLLLSSQSESHIRWQSAIHKKIFSARRIAP